jgi:C1A family cysteine protease
MISPAEFGEGLKSGRIALTSAQIQHGLSVALAEEVNADRKRVEKLIAEMPEIAERLRRILNDPKEDDMLVKLGDDNYKLTLRDEGANGEQPKVITMGQRFAYAETNRSLSEFFTQRNQLGVYVELFDSLPQQYRTQEKLPHPSQIAEWSAEELLEINLRMVRDTPAILKLIPGIFVILPPPCSAEEGAPAVLTDQVGGSCSPSGSIWSNYEFPLKYRATCVKNQASRGTCVSFGIGGAVEAAIAKKHGRWVNLSEQRLYYRAKVPTAYGDGLNTSGTMNNAVADAFFWPFERDWDYNPSQSRNDTGSAYLNSCVGYSGEHCSNTAHQGDRVCMRYLFWTFCGWNGTAPGSSGFRLTGSSNLFDFGLSTGVALGRLASAIGVPLVMSFAVTPSFDGAASNGVATYVGSGEGNRGGHAVAVLGQIDNSRLPDGIPAGAGGGYFIVKNSWGQCWKDGGYVYLPFQWVQDYAYSLRTVSGIN